VRVQVPHVRCRSESSISAVRAAAHNGRPRTGVELEERTEREALFAYGTTLYNVERLFRYVQGVRVGKLRRSARLQLSLRIPRGGWISREHHEVRSLTR